MVRQVSADHFITARQPSGDTTQSPRAARVHLSVDELVGAVLMRHPSLAEMTAGWQAASARYGQVTSLEDPMFRSSFAPGSIGSDEVDFAYRLQLSQKLPYPGKLALRGQQASAEAAAAGDEVEDMRLQLVETTKNAFYEYYLVTRALEVNAENLRRLKEAQENAAVRAKNNLAPQQDLLQAEVELARQRERELQLQRMQQVAVARINTLLRMPPDSPLAAPPRRLALGDALPDVEQLRAMAQANRPDLRALGNRLAADEAALRLAQKEFYPDFEVEGAYDAFWQEKPLRSMVGVNVNVPIRLQRRHAAVAEAEAKIAQRSAQLARLSDQANFEVQEAYAQAVESERVVRLYEKTIQRAGEPNVSEALTAYTTGKVPFLSLVEAQRNLITLRDRYFEAMADYYRRLARLERVVGGPVLPPVSREEDQSSSRHEGVLPTP